MNREQNLKEIREARAVGQQALASLEDARNLLDSAGNWGLLDMFGGGLISGMMKHSKMNNANEQMERARYLLQNFQKELRDIDVPGSFRVNVSDFLVFADFFFDGLIADWLVQSKISEAESQVVEAMEKVRTILNNLNQWEAQLLRGI
ncbi:MAG: hypothetical protein EOM40_09005 [Clostridia bacterium]|nr:hypothetical protein [Clostridia bacterium]NCC42127.1 hypothetical protein [Clostridia bacterium]